MKKLLLYLLAAVASLAWVFIILALSLALLDPRSSIRQDPVLVSIAVLVFIGHLGSGSYLVRSIRDDILQARRKGRSLGDGRH